MAEILGGVVCKTNAELIDYIQPLYLPPSAHVCDVTWGKGNWWTRYQPDIFTAHDLYTLDGVDYTNLPEEDETYDRVIFDPPYVSKGGRKTTGIGAFDDAYGLRDAPLTPAALTAQNVKGLGECARVVKRRGLVLVKTMNYVSSGKIVWGAHRMSEAARDLGLVQIDEFVHLSGLRPQPAGRRQVHARRNYSYLLVFGR